MEESTTNNTRNAEEKLKNLIHLRNRMVVNSPYTENGLDVIRIDEWKKQPQVFIGTLLDTFLFKTSKSEIEKVLIRQLSEKRLKVHNPFSNENLEDIKKSIEADLEKIKKTRGGELFDASTQQRYQRELQEDIRNQHKNSSISR